MTAKVRGRYCLKFFSSGRSRDIPEREDSIFLRMAMAHRIVSAADNQAAISTLEAQRTLINRLLQ